MARISIAADRRGLLPLGRLVVSTTYPLGWFYAWSYVEPGMRCIVYPRPASQVSAPPQGRVDSSGERLVDHSGSDDFQGLRPHLPSDSPRHIAWKRAANTDQLRTKQFAATAGGEVELDWHALPATLDLETRLSWLARWVVDCAREGLRYGLRLPDQRLPAAHGDAHRRRCLELLAAFGVP